MIRIAILVLSLLVACQPNTPETDPALLLETEAIERKSLLSEIRYILDMKLPKEGEFQGKVDISFELSKKPSSLRLDFAEGKVEELRINNQTSPISYNNYSITLPGDLLQVGSNQISIHYTHPYSTTGNGLHRFVDPADGKIYLYTQFEAFHANKMFPCFDQPDLKATYKLRVEAPSDWVLISATIPTTEGKQNSSGNSIWNFPETQKFSTYLLSLQAGNYKEWKKTATTPKGQIPLRIFSRQSLAKYVPVDFWFESTEKGLVFFEKYFEIPYPFGKYDQIIVPEFNFGAMENVGAVNFSERFVARGTLTRSEKQHLNEVILHEMAHMWFGNLVTMKWWSGLWLNESFASYMSFLAEHSATEFQESWNGFFYAMKAWGYSEDRLSTTHPIETKIKDTEEAFTNFDGITYGKGASVLKQLSFLLGEEVFRKGVSDYLKTYSYSNAELKDFLSELEKASQTNSQKPSISLQDWSSTWLQKKGVNTAQTEWSCKGGKISSFTILQSAGNQDSSLRTHSTQIALFQKENNSSWKLFHKERAVYQSKSTDFPSLVGKPCPDFVYSNFEDYDYAFHKLDPISRKALASFLAETKDDALKHLLWHGLWMEVMEGDSKLDDYSQLAISLLPKETDELLLSSLLSKLTSSGLVSYHSSLYWISDANETKRKLSELETFLWKGVETSPSRTDKKKIWFRSFLSVASSDSALDKLLPILTNPNLEKELDLTADDRWRILLRLSSFSYRSLEVEAILSQEKAKDNSERARNYLYAIQAAKPEPESKKTAWNQIVSQDKSISNASRYAMARAIFPLHQKDYHKAYQSAYYETVASFNASTDVNYAENFSSILLPTFCTHESTKELTQFLKKHTKIPSSAIHEMQGGLDSERDCLRIRDRNSKP